MGGKLGKSGYLGKSGLAQWGGGGGGRGNGNGGYGRLPGGVAPGGSRALGGAPRRRPLGQGAGVVSRSWVGLRGGLLPKAGWEGPNGSNFTSCFIPEIRWLRFVTSIKGPPPPTVRRRISSIVHLSLSSKSCLLHIDLSSSMPLFQSSPSSARSAKCVFFFNLYNALAQLPITQVAF